MIRVRGQAWRRQAVCFLETSDAPELWTPDHLPGRTVRGHLEQMCRRCPVRRQCAAEAVSSDAEGGIYAGVWVPDSHQRKSWAAAMALLRGIAGLDPLEHEFAALRDSA